MPVNWLELVVEIDAADCEQAEALLFDCGAQALTLHDAGNEPVLEPLPGETPVWPHLRIIALFQEDVNQADIEATLDAALPAAFRQWRALKDQQWERVWLTRFKPRRFGRRLWVIPTGFEPAEGDDDISLMLDPGLAFGTGDHATTDLCLQWLDSAPIADNRVLDYGHGSGILAIAARKLGATDVVGIDIDPQAVIAGNDNAKRNSVSDGIRFLTRDVDETFDVVVANILAGPLIGMAQRLSAYLQPGGHIALSGLLTGQIGEVQTAYAPWIEWQDAQRLEDWALICGVRNDHPAE